MAGDRRGATQAAARGVTPPPLYFEDNQVKQRGTYSTSLNEVHSFGPTDFCLYKVLGEVHGLRGVTMRLPKSTQGEPKGSLRRAQRDWGFGFVGRVGARRQVLPGMRAPVSNAALWGWACENGFATRRRGGSRAFLTDEGTPIHGGGFDTATAPLLFFWARWVVGFNELMCTIFGCFVFFKRIRMIWVTLGVEVSQLSQVFTRLFMTQTNSRQPPNISQH